METGILALCPFTLSVIVYTYYIPQEMYQTSLHDYQTISQQPRYWDIENRCHDLTSIAIFFWSLRTVPKQNVGELKKLPK